MRLTHFPRAALLTVVTLSGCAKDSSDDGSDDTSTPVVVDDDTDTDTDTDSDTDTDTDADVYEFESAVTGGSSVKNTGQIMRQVLVDDMASELQLIDDMVQNYEIGIEPGQVTSRLEFYFDFDGDTSGGVAILQTFDAEAEQTTYGEISTKNLVDKIAGNDSATDHKDWSTEFEGWGAKGSTTPEGLVRTWFDMIDAQAVAWVAADIPLDPRGNPVASVYVTPQGHDLRRLLGTFLRGAINFSQGADDYMDDDTAGKGLLASHEFTDSAYTRLEHVWDEGFGYFGGARNYGDWSDDDIASIGHLDVDGNGTINLFTEVNWGHSVNAANRDRGANIATDFTQQAWDGFLGGRKLLHDTVGTALTAMELHKLLEFRDHAIGGWENGMAATAIHHINYIIQEMNVMDTADYSFANHAKHWGELKGVALSLQFNPNSPLSDDHFTTVHGLIRDAPIIEFATSDERALYIEDLIKVRGILGDAYGFEPDNLGDENGENGW